LDGVFLGVLFKRKKTEQKQFFCGPHLFSSALGEKAWVAATKNGKWW
jgi:hypothetical protein